MIDVSRASGQPTASGSQHTAADAAPPENEVRRRRRSILIPAFCSSCTLFLLLLVAAHGGATDQLDAAVHRWMCSDRSPLLSDIAVGVSVLGSTPALALGTIVAMGVLLRGRGRRAAFDPAIAGIVGWVAIASVKQMLDRPRPPAVDHLVVVSDPSFPSGHAAGIASLLTVIAIHVIGSIESRPRRLVCFLSCGLVVMAVGWSRIHLGVHFTSDVAAGFCLGVACGVVAPGLGKIVHGLARGK